MEKAREPAALTQATQQPDRRLLLFLARHCAGGIAAAWALLLGLVKTDVAGLGSLLESSRNGAAGYALIAVVFALTGGAVGMGLGVFSLDEFGDSPDAPGYKAQDDPEDDPDNDAG